MPLPPMMPMTGGVPGSAIRAPFSAAMPRSSRSSVCAGPATRLRASGPEQGKGRPFPARPFPIPPGCGTLVDFRPDLALHGIKQPGEQHTEDDDLDPDAVAHLELVIGRATALGDPVVRHLRHPRLGGGGISDRAVREPRRHGDLMAREG